MKILYDYLADYNIEFTEDSGKEIARFKRPFYTHTGIILGRNKYSQEKQIFHNHKDTGPAIVPIYSYNNGYKCYYTDKPQDSWEVVLLRSFKQVESNNQYNLPDYNCQHATSISRTGISYSHGVANTVGVLAIAGFLGLLFGALGSSRT